MDFNNKNLLAIDYGKKVVGLAQICPGREPFPYPAGRIIVAGRVELLHSIKQHVEDETIDIIIVGLPFLLDGKESTMTVHVRQFAKELKATCSQEVIYLQDETLTSYEAQERMKNLPRYNFKVDPKQIDALAATIILEDFLTSETFCLV